LSEHDKDWAMLLFPIMILYALYEIKRGIAVIHDNKYYPTLVEKIRQTLFRSPDISGLNDNSNNEITHRGELKKSGYYSIVVGIIYIILFTFLFFYALGH